MAGDEKEQASAGQKHQTDHESPIAKRTRTSDDAKQPTIEEAFEGKTEDAEESGKTETNNVSNGKNHDKKQTKDEDKETKENEDKDAPVKSKGGDESAVKPGEEEDVPSNILEKGIVYFFIRGRVNISHPESVSDIARSYMLLRPLPTDAKLGDGPIGDAGNTRLLALPKKVLPLSGKDRFMVFVEKSDASFQTIKDEFLKGEDYETKTAGTRHTPAATPAGEGVYAITTTGRESHLAYMLTLPETLEEVQKDLGLREKGSFIISTKNPEYPGPANAQLPNPPKFPKR